MNLLKISSMDWALEHTRNETAYNKQYENQTPEILHLKCIVSQQFLSGCDNAGGFHSFYYSANSARFSESTFGIDIAAALLTSQDHSIVLEYSHIFFYSLSHFNFIREQILMPETTFPRCALSVNINPAIFFLPVCLRKPGFLFACSCCGCLSLWHYQAEKSALEEKKKMWFHN
jgi:hypothetical protein